MSDEPVDPMVWRKDLPKRLDCNTETIRRWMHSGKLPKPDVEITLRKRGWKLSTLRAAGINLA